MKVITYSAAPSEGVFELGIITALGSAVGRLAFTSTFEMSTTEAMLRLITGGFLILTNGFFVAIEFALTRARQYSASEFDEPGLRRAWEMTDDLELYLTSCQVGITASSIAVGIVAEPALVALFEPVFAGSKLAGVGVGAVLAFLLINLVHLTHGEQTPTYLGVERTKTVCRYGAPPLYWFYRLIAPVMWIGDGVAKVTLRLFGVEMTGAWLETGTDAIESRAELRNRLNTVLNQGNLSSERRTEVLNALTIGDQSVREVMIRPDSIVAISTEVDSHENLQRLAEEPHTRYPLVGEGLQDPRGIVYVPELFRHRESLKSGTIDFEAIASPPMTMAVETTVSDAIDQFQAERQELAFVTDDEKIVGMLTITDALEAVMGDVRDPIDEEFGIA